MALKLYERYPQLWESPSNDYPQGAFKNLSAQGETDGSYLEKDWLNDYSGFFGALLRNAEMTPDGTIDTAQKSQFYDALIKVAKGAVADQGYATKTYVDNKFNEVPKTEIINDWDQASDENVFSAGFVSKLINQGADGNTIIKSGLQTFTFPSMGNGGEIALTSYVDDKIADIDTSNLVTKDDITNELGDSTELVASQALVNSTNNKIDYALVDFGLIDSRTTYEKECPFGDSPVITMLEIYVDGKWYEVKALNMIYISSTNIPTYGGFSTKLGSRLYVQRGHHGFAYNVEKGLINTLLSKTVTSANARVHVWRIGK